MFRPVRTFSNPGSGSGVQRGFPMVGQGAQSASLGGLQPAPFNEPPSAHTKGRRSWFTPAAGSNAQRGFPSPGSGEQIRPNGSMPNVPPIYGQSLENMTPYYSRGAAAVVQNFGKVLENPIGAGIPVGYRSQASYGPSAQYINSSLWWTSQVVPTSINLQGLTDPAALNAILGSTLVQAVVRNAQ